MTIFYNVRLFRPRAGYCFLFPLHLQLSERQSIWFCIRLWFFMAPRKMWPPTTLQALEEDVKVVWAYRDDIVVDKQVELFVLDLGSNCSRDTKFLCTVELYWHTKSFMAQAMITKEPYCKEFRLRLDALEEQNRLLLTLVFSLVKKHGGYLHLSLEGTTSAPQHNSAAMRHEGLNTARPQVPST